MISLRAPRGPRDAEVAGGTVAQMRTHRDVSHTPTASDLELLTDEILSETDDAAPSGSHKKMSEMDPLSAALVALTEGVEELASRGPTAAEAAFAPVLRLVADHLADDSLRAPGTATNATAGDPETLTAQLRISVTGLCHGYEPDDGEGWGFVEAALALHELVSAHSPRDPASVDPRCGRALTLAADAIDSAVGDRLLQTLGESGPIVVRRPGTKPVTVSRGRH